MSSVMDYELERPVPNDEDGDTEFIQVEVTYNWYRAHRGYRNSLGVPEEPDEPAHAEVDSITTEDGTEIKVSDEEMAAIEEACLKHAEGDTSW